MRERWNIDGFVARTAAKAERGVSAAAHVVEQRAQEKLREPGSGRMYPRGKTRSHRASAPGEAPASDTGRLLGSLNTETRRERDAVVGVVSATAEYALPLELGTEKIAARPFMVPSLSEMKDRALSAFVANAR